MTKCVFLLLCIFPVCVTFTLLQPQTGPCGQKRMGNGNIYIDCHVHQGQFVDYRYIRILTAQYKDVKFTVTIKCNGGRIFLPWPFRAENVISLSVAGCDIEGYMSENMRKQTLPDELEYVSIVESKLEISLKQLHDSLVNIQSISKDYECGQTNAKVSIFRNIEYKFRRSTKPLEDMVLLEQLLMPDRLKELLRTGNVCRYPNLKYMETSGSRSISSIHFKLLEAGQYPKLSTYSARNNSLFTIPEELKNLKLGFLPKLTKLDLSSNKISDIDFIFSVGKVDQDRLVVDLRSNAIRHISRDTVLQLIKSKRVLLDLRLNPLMCSCALDLYRTHILRLATADPKIVDYIDFKCIRNINGQKDCGYP